MRLKYYIKTQPKIIVRLTIIIYIFALLNNISAADISMWNQIKLILILIPSFFTGQIVAGEFENKVEGIIFVSKTPKYKYIMNRFILELLINQIIIFLIYLSAVYTGLESNISGYLILVVNSAFLAAISLTAANISKSTLIGYGVPVMYWGMQLLAGAKFNEAILPFSVIIGILISQEILWQNIITLSVITFVLLVINIWYSSKGENIRHILTKSLCVCFSIGAIIAILYGYYDYENNTIQYNIMHKKDTLFVLCTKNSSLKQYLDSNNIKYVYEDKISKKKFDNQNVVVITEMKKLNSEIIKNTTNIFKNISLKNNSVKIKEQNIINANCYRVICKNNKNNYLILLDSNNWNKGEIKLLFNKKSGNFIAGQYDKCIDEENYNLHNISSLYEKEILQSNSWKFIENGNAKVVYDKIPVNRANELLKIWGIVKNEVDNITFNKSQSTYLQVYCGGDRKIPNKNAVPLLICGKTFFEPYKSEGEDRVSFISTIYLEESVFKNLEDDDLKDAWSSYIYKTKIIPIMRKKISQSYWNKNYDTLPWELDGDYIQYITDTQHEKINNDNCDTEALGAYIIHLIQKDKKSFHNVLNYICKGNSKISDEQLKKVLEKYYDREKITKAFRKYDKALKLVRQYETSRWVRSK